MCVCVCVCVCKSVSVAFQGLIPVDELRVPYSLTFSRVRDKRIPCMILCRIGILG